MSNEMYHKSKVWIKNAYDNLEAAKQGNYLDDAYFDIACFNAQQAIEFVLKAILIKYGVKFDTKGRHGHDILALTDLVSEETPFTFEKYDELETIATTITMWEAKGRYHTSIKTKESTVKRVLDIYHSIDQEFSKIIAS